MPIVEVKLVSQDIICAEPRLDLFLRSASKHIVYLNKLTVPRETLVEERF